MSDTIESPDTRKSALKGLGSARKRVEDARFTQGKGNYVDDIKMDGMLFGDFVRSPYAHARVVSVDKQAALALPGVHAVLTAEDLAPLSLHWMPTLAGDKQMVLADGKVLFQGQEVAFIIADDRYVAADAVELVDVEYEELPVVVDPTWNGEVGTDNPVYEDSEGAKTAVAPAVASNFVNRVFIAWLEERAAPYASGNGVYGVVVDDGVAFLGHRGEDGTA